MEEEFKKLIKELDEKKQILDVPCYFIEYIKRYIEEKYRGQKFQYGSWGDFGWCAFIGNSSIIIPVTKEHYDLWFYAV